MSPKDSATHLILDHVPELLDDALLHLEPLDDLGLLQHLGLVTGPPGNTMGMITSLMRCYDAKMVMTLRRILIMIIMTEPCAGN